MIERLLAYMAMLMVYHKCEIGIVVHTIFTLFLFLELLFPILYFFP